MSEEQDEIQRRFGDRLRVEGKLGQGGMGAVYRVISQGRVCALKVLMKSAVADAAAMRRFLQEGRVLAQLEHENVIRLYELGEDPTFPYLLCEFVDGESLDVLVAREGPLPWDRALALTDQLLAGLAAAHAIDVIHRDIKPSNVLVGRDGSLKLADFGIAKAEQLETKHTTTGMIVGTPAYIAPEVLRGEKPTPRADVFSTGVLLYELLVGRLPWEHTEAGALLTERIMMTEAPQPTRRNDRLPKSLDALVQTALAPRPVDRYPSAAVFRAAIASTRKQLVSAVGAPAQTAAMSQASLVRRTTATRAPSGATPLPDAPPPLLRRAPAAPPPAARNTGLALALVALASVTIWSIGRTRPRPVASAPAERPADLRGADPTDEEQRLYQELRLEHTQPSALKSALGTARGVQLTYRAWRVTSGATRIALREALAGVEHPLAIPALVDQLVTVDGARREEAAATLRARVREALEAGVSPESLDARDELSTQLCDLLGREHGTMVPALARALIATLGWLRDPATSEHCFKFMALAQSADPEAQKLFEQALGRFEAGPAREHAARERAALR